MRVCVFGLWHLGSVTAACLAAAGHQVVGLDLDAQIVTDLCAGKPPIFEPGLTELIAEGLASGRLRFTTVVTEAIADADVVWVTFDTPVDEDDAADVDFVFRRVTPLFRLLRDGTVLLVSSQLPVGSIRYLEDRFAEAADGRTCHIAVLPENLRLGNAISTFRKADRLVVGIRDDRTRAALEPLLATVSPHIVWMDVESAEVTKHAINAFLATSITFANEIAAVCERVGADAREVARGLKTESRIGPGAYVNPGGPFAGGTLARDINFLMHVGREHGLDLPVLSAVLPSNDRHRNWIRRMLSELLPDLEGSRIAIFGLPYKAGTDTLRRSTAIELGVWLSSRGSQVHAYDPTLRSLPQEVNQIISLCASAEEAVAAADAAVLVTDTPALRALAWSSLVELMLKRIVVDPSGGLASWALAHPNVTYAAVGLARRA